MRTCDYHLKFSNGSSVIDLRSDGSFIKSIQGYILSSRLIGDKSKDERPVHLIIKFGGCTKTNYSYTYNTLSNKGTIIPMTYPNCYRIGTKNIKISRDCLEIKAWNNAKIFTLNEEGKLIPYTEDIQVILTMSLEYIPMTFFEWLRGYQ